MLGRAISHPQSHSIRLPCHISIFHVNGIKRYEMTKRYTRNIIIYTSDSLLHAHIHIHTHIRTHLLLFNALLWHINICVPHLPLVVHLRPLMGMFIIRYIFLHSFGFWRESLRFCVSFRFVRFDNNLSPFHRIHLSYIC